MGFNIRKQVEVGQSINNIVNNPKHRKPEIRIRSKLGRSRSGSRTLNTLNTETQGFKHTKCKLKTGETNRETQGRQPMTGPWVETRHELKQKHTWQSKQNKHITT